MPQEKKSRVHIGVGGWTYEPWRGTFYPAGLVQRRELAYASNKLTSIEINGTYYGLQKPETFARWRDETPDGFVFSLKAPRIATNRRLLSSAGEIIDRFLMGVMELEDKLGVINWQFMPTKRFDPADFEDFLERLPKQVDGRALRHAVEVRHQSFQTPEFVALLRAHGVGVVVAADSHYPQIADVTAPFVYARIMGTKETERLGYSDAALDVWAQRVRAWASGGIAAGLQTVDNGPPDEIERDVFLYVISGHKVLNPAAAMALSDRVAGRNAPPRSPLTWIK